MTSEQERLVLQILSQLHKRGYEQRFENGTPVFVCIYCDGASAPGALSPDIRHKADCVHFLSLDLEKTLIE
jgi:hypothetical protein